VVTRVKSVIDGFNRLTQKPAPRIDCRERDARVGITIGDGG